MEMLFDLQYIMLAFPQWKWKPPRRPYPRGSKVAVKQPYFKQGAQDGVLMLLIDNPQDIEILSSFYGNAETYLAKDLFELPSEGKKYFCDGDWNMVMGIGACNGHQYHSSSRSAHSGIVCDEGRTS